MIVRGCELSWLNPGAPGHCSPLAPGVDQLQSVIAMFTNSRLSFGLANGGGRLSFGLANSGGRLSFANGGGRLSFSLANGGGRLSCPHSSPLFAGGILFRFNEKAKLFLCQAQLLTGRQKTLRVHAARWSKKSTNLKSQQYTQQSCLNSK